mmetsp:Transcript_44789/g.102820  ORF Transcript_44789/g.102820 Transcript_44789/m.102820 type:complete len:240 (-) Transcript_44789:313-1032(-)
MGVMDMLVLQVHVGQIEARTAPGAAAMLLRHVVCVLVRVRLRRRSARRWHPLRRLGDLAFHERDDLRRRARMTELGHRLRQHEQLVLPFLLRTLVEPLGGGGELAERRTQRYCLPLRGHLGGAERRQRGEQVRRVAHVAHLRRHARRRAAGGVVRAVEPAVCAADLSDLQLAQLEVCRREGGGVRQGEERGELHRLPVDGAVGADARGLRVAGSDSYDKGRQLGGRAPRGAEGERVDGG